MGIDAVFRSWMIPRAVKYREVGCLRVYVCVCVFMCCKNLPVGAVDVALQHHG